VKREKRRDYSDYGSESNGDCFIAFQFLIVLP